MKQKEGSTTNQTSEQMKPTFKTMMRQTIDE